MIIEQLMKHCPEISITLTLDQLFMDRHQMNCICFVYQVRIAELYMEMAAVNGIESRRNHITRTTTMADPSLQHLEAILIRGLYNVYNGEQFHSYCTGCKP